MTQGATKRFFFLSGFPRSGGTLLSSLLNQHPSIYSSPHSLLHQAFWDMTETFIHIEDSQVAPLQRNSEAVVNFPHWYYRDVEKNIVVDRSFNWGTPGNIHLIQHFEKYPRIIFTYRPILNVLASYIQIMNNNPTNKIDQQIEISDFYPRAYLSLNDTRAEFIMSQPEMMPRCILAYAISHQPKYREMFHKVSYDDLVTRTQDTLNNIYDFMDAPKHMADVENIINPHFYRDKEILNMENLHLVRRTIKKESPNPEQYFSNFILEKYDNYLEKLTKAIKGEL